MKWHATDVVSLLFGLAFLGLAMLWLLARYAEVPGPVLAKSAAAGMIAIGVVGVVRVLTTRPGRSR